MSDISRRILEIAALYKSEKGITNQKFLENCELNHSFLSTLKSGRIKTPSGDALKAILDYTNCSAEWLMRGQGEMFDRPNPTGKAGQKEADTDALIQEGEEILDRLEGSVEKYKAIVAGEENIQLSWADRRRLLELLLLDDLRRSDDEG
ncbi:MAG: helix-turn-helix domain-containing protein [Bacteroidota bacterium]